MKQTIVSIFGQSWRTAITAYAGAIFTACLPIIQTGHFNLKTDWPYLVGAAGAAIFGSVAKDAKVSGTGPTISDELKAAQEALAVAQSTHHDKLIQMAQAVVDGLQKAA